MKKRYVIGVDIGTTTMKAVFVDANENRIATVQIEEMFTVQGENADFVEYDANNWRECIKKVLKQGFETGIDPLEVAGISILDFTVMAFLVDENGKPLNNPVHYNDFRHLKEAEELKKTIGSLCIERNNNYMGMYNGLAKQYWWKQNKPEIYAKAKYFVTGASWVNYLLTGQWAMSRCAAGFYGQYNAYTRQWDAEILDKIGMDKDKFPPLLDAWEVVGKVTKQASKEWGLAEGTCVFAGMDDASPVALTSGVIKDGQCFISAGSGANVAVNTKEMLCHETALSYPHCIPGLNLTVGVMTSTGLSYKWMRNQFGAVEEMLAKFTGKDAYDYLGEQAAKAKPGSGGVIFLPYLDGDYTPNNDPNARGCFIGMGTGTTRGEMIRAVLEGVGYSFLSSMMLIRSLGGELNEIVITGGIAKSALWLQIISDISGLEISLPQEVEGAPLGSALIAGIGCGLFKDYEDAVERLVKIERRVIKPNDGNHRLYMKLFDVYESLYPKLKGVYTQLKDIREYDKKQ